MTTIEGRVALVTGATRGIGLSIAQELVAHGATVVLNYRRDTERAEQALGTVASAGPGTASLLQADVSDAHEVERMFKQVRGDHGRLDMFVSNAGVTADGYALLMGEQKWRSVLDTNLTGSFLALRAAARLMRRHGGGSIVAISSTSALAPPAGQANYAAAKAGLMALVRVLAKELGEHGIRVNAVVPGFVDTAMTRQMPPEQLDRALAHVPLGRIGAPEEIAPVVRLLLSDEASYITGTSLVIDGGLTC